MKRGSSQNSFFRDNPNTIESLFTAFYGFQSGTLLVQVHEAKGFVKQNLSCTLECEKQVYTTNSINTKEESLWEEEFKFEVKSNRSELEIVVHYLKKKNAKGTLGKLVLNVKDFSSGSLLKGWYQVLKKGKPVGEIFLLLQYMSEVELNKDYNIVKANFRKLMDIVSSHDLVIFSVLSSVYESEDLAKTSIRVFNSDGQALRLLVQLLYRDLKKAHSKDTLFREDSMATKTTRNYFLMIAPDYLKNIVQGILAKVIASSFTFEIDSRKIISSKIDVQSNIQKLGALVQETIDKVLNSIDSLPTNIRKFFNLLRQLVKQAYPEMETKILGSFFFLRLICPVIINPSITGEQVTLSDEEKRILIYISKVIQYLANGMLEFREPQFVPFNYILTSNQPKLLKFCEQLSTIPPDHNVPDGNKRKYNEEDKTKGLSIIFGQLRMNAASIEKSLHLDPRMKEPQVSTNTMQQWEFIKELMK